VKDQNNNFECWMTGGGCEAYGMNIPGGGDVLITHWQGADLPEVGGKAIVGLNTADGYMIGKVRFVRFDGQATFDRIANDLLGGEGPLSKAHKRGKLAYAVHEFKTAAKKVLDSWDDNCGDYPREWQSFDDLFIDLCEWSASLSGDVN
jgi:hypothetical protein